jgi:hypothetical protein
LIKVDFDWDFALNKYSLRAYLHSFPTILNDNVNQLETDKGQDSNVDVPLFLLPIVLIFFSYYLVIIVSVNFV